MPPAAASIVKAMIRGIMFALGQINLGTNIPPRMPAIKAPIAAIPRPLRRALE